MIAGKVEHTQVVDRMEGQGQGGSLGLAFAKDAV